MDFSLIHWAVRQEASPRLAEHPELDEPDGELTWESWLEGRQRLETALLIGCR